MIYDESAVNIEIQKILLFKLEDCCRNILDINRGILYCQVSVRINVLKFSSAQPSIVTPTICGYGRL